MLVMYLKVGSTPILGSCEFTGYQNWIALEGASFGDGGTGGKSTKITSEKFQKWRDKQLDASEVLDKLLERVPRAQRDEVRGKIQPAVEKMVSSQTTGSEALLKEINSELKKSNESEESESEGLSLKISVEKKVDKASKKLMTLVARSRVEVPDVKLEIHFVGVAAPGEENSQALKPRWINPMTNAAASVFPFVRLAFEDVRLHSFEVSVAAGDIPSESLEFRATKAAIQCWQMPVVVNAGGKPTIEAQQCDMKGWNVGGDSPGDWKPA